VGEEQGGRPACVNGTGRNGDVGMIRIMFPDSAQSEHEGLTEIGWNDFFEQFDANGLALLYEEDRMFSKIIGRDSA
jgi:hypothetical protein